MSGRTSTPTNSSAPAPVVVTPETNEVRIKVGQRIDVNAPDTANVYTNNPKVLEIYQPNPNSDPPYNGGAKAIGVGTAIFTLNHKGGGVAPITVIVTN